MPIPNKKPLTEEERRNLLLLLNEAQARGVRLPEEAKKALVDKKKMQWPLDPKGYFLRDDGHPYIPSEAHKNFLASNARNVMLYGPRGCGKALDVNTLIPTPTGWSTMGALNVGDWVFDERGMPVEVLDISPVMYDHSCYDVIFDDGSVITADAEHIWTTLTAKDRSNKDSAGKWRMKRGKRVLRKPAHWEYRDITTEEIRTSLTTNKRGDINHSVDVALPLSMDDIELQVPPYVMGLWLGDGNSSGSGITIGNQDIKEQRKILSEFDITLISHKADMHYRMEYKNEAPVFRNDFGQMESNPNSLFGRLQFYNVINNKNIPLEYLRSSYKQRLLLLQGLMDSDGTIDKGGRCEFSVSSEILAMDFYELCMTLGIKATYKKGIVKFRGKNFDRYRISFTPYIPVFRLPRKLRRVKPKGNQSNRRYRRYIVEVRPVESVPVKCITVDSNTHLYLAGESFIPTHNSAAGSQKALMKIKQGLPGIIMNPDFENLKISTWPEFKRWIPWDMVVPSQRHRGADVWQPSQPFMMAFLNGAKVYIKGGKDSSGSRGPNVNWFWYDEGGRDETGLSWQITNAGVRIGKDPQAFCTETPRPTEHWSYKFFIAQDIDEKDKEEFEKASKGDRILIEYFHASRADNEKNLDPTFYANLAVNYPSGWLRAQEYDGEFANEGGKVGDRSWFNEKVLDDAPASKRKVRFWDLAATEKKNAKDDPDEAVGSLISKFVPDDEFIEKYKAKKGNNYCIEHQIGGFWSWENLLVAIANTAKIDGPYVPVVLEEEPGSGGKNQVAAVAEYFKRFPELKSHQVIGQRARDVGDRVMAANHWFSLASEGLMWMVKGDWNNGFLSQLDGFTQVIHDDKVTSVTGGMTYIRPFKNWKKVPFISLA